MCSISSITNSYDSSIVDFIPSTHTSKVSISNLLSVDSDEDFLFSPHCTTRSPSQSPVPLDELCAVHPPVSSEISTNLIGTRNTSPGEKRDTSRHPRRRNRADSYQLAVLNSVFAHTIFPSTDLRQRLSKELGMSARSVQIWFQNKRQQWRIKKKMEENERKIMLQQQHIQRMYQQNYWTGYYVGPEFLPSISVPLGGMPLTDRLNEALNVHNRLQLPGEMLSTRQISSVPFSFGQQYTQPPT